MGLTDLFKKRETIEKQVLEKAGEFIERTIKERSAQLEADFLEKQETTVQLRSLTERGPYNYENEFSTSAKEVNLQNYERYVWTYAAVYAIANSAAQTPLKVYNTNPDGTRGEEILEGRFWDLINRPNKYQTGYDLIEAIVSSLELTGDSYVEQGGSNPVEPTQLYPLRPDWMEIVPDAKQMVKEYRYQTNGKTIIFEPTEVLHTKYYHPRSELYGLSPIQPSNQSIILDLYTQTFQKKFFLQGGMISSYISVPGSLSDHDFNRLKAQFTAEFSGIKNAHKFGLIDNAGKIETIGTDLKNLLLTEQKNQNRDEILAAFGVPPVMVGLLDAATFNNTNEQKKAFWQNTMKPKLKKIQDRFNQAFFWAYDVECEFDLSTVESLKEDQVQKSTTAVNLANAGIMTPNEVREHFYQLPPLPGGDALKTAAPASPVMFSQTPPVPEPRRSLPPGQ